MAVYRLSAHAEVDFADIYRYSVLTFGEARADVYASDLIEAFGMLGRNPLAGEDVSTFRSETRRLNHDSHAIYYDQINGEVVRILRILHQTQDPLRHL